MPFATSTIICPSPIYGASLAAVAPYIGEGQILVDVATGIERDTHYTMTEIIADEMKRCGIVSTRLVALSGPTHAEEVALDLPTTIVAASSDATVM